MVWSWARIRASPCKSRWVDKAVSAETEGTPAKKQAAERARLTRSFPARFSTPNSLPAFALILLLCQNLETTHPTRSPARAAPTNTFPPPILSIFLTTSLSHTLHPSTSSTTTHFHQLFILQLLLFDYSSLLQWPELSRLPVSALSRLSLTRVDATQHHDTI